MKKEFHQIETDHKVYEVDIKPSELSFSKNELINSLGYTITNFPEHFEFIIDEILSGINSYCDIKAGYKIVTIEKSKDLNNGLIIENSFFNLDKIITHQLKNAEQGGIFVCTIGQGMEIWLKQALQNGDNVRSFFIDATASAIVESTADLIHTHIGESAKSKGMNFTNRYSPGYCNWNVIEQLKLFSLLPKKFCGVTLNDSAMMIPIKSISGIIGLGKKVKMQEYSCEICGVKDCTHRQIRLNKKRKLKQNLLA